MSEDKRKVMLIDDNIISLMVTAEVLSTHGYTVTKTATAQGCIAKVEYEQPDVVLIDPSMPRLAIDTLLETIREGDIEKMCRWYCSRISLRKVGRDYSGKNDGYFSKSIEVTRLPEYMENFSRLTPIRDLLSKSPWRRSQVVRQSLQNLHSPARSRRRLPKRPTMSGVFLLSVFTI